MYISYVAPLHLPCFCIFSLFIFPELIASEHPPERKPWTVSRSRPYLSESAPGASDADVSVPIDLAFAKKFPP